MSNYDSVIFDKDGVLLDSGLDNFRWKDKARVKKAQEKDIELTITDSMKIVESSTAEEIENFLDKTSMSWEDLEEIEKSVQETKIEMIRQGVIWLFPEAQKTLKQVQKPAALATNAPRKVTEYTVENFDLRKNFKAIKSPEITPIKQYFKRKKPKPVMLEEIIQENNFQNPLMVGDTSSDIKAAENAGIDSVHVLSYSNQKNPTATYKVKNISEIQKILK